MPLVRRRYHVTGMVQGVGFRYFVQREAGRLGVSGFVRNRRDGSVEVEGEADASILDLFRGELERGPESAMVGKVEVTELEIREESGFRILF